jgi:hypothetical protein
VRIDGNSDPDCLDRELYLVVFANAGQVVTSTYIDVSAVSLKAVPVIESGAS